MVRRGRSLETVPQGKDSFRILGIYETDVADVCLGIFVVETEICRQSARQVILDSHGDGFLVGAFYPAVLTLKRPGQNAEFHTNA